MKPKHYYCKTWKANVEFLIGWKPEDLKKFFANRLEKDFSGKSGSCFSMQNDSGENHYFIWTLKKPTNSRNKAVLAHEISHCVSFIFSDRGVVADWINDEPACYLVEELTEFAYSNCMRKK